MCPELLKGMLLIKFSMKKSSGNVLLFYPNKYLTLISILLSRRLVRLVTVCDREPSNASTIIRPKHILSASTNGER